MPFWKTGYLRIGLACSHTGLMKQFVASEGPMTIQALCMVSTDNLCIHPKRHITLSVYVHLYLSHPSKHNQCLSSYTCSKHLLISLCI